MNSTNDFTGNKSSTLDTAECVDDGEEWGNTHHSLVMVGSSILICFGTVGNMVCFCILQQKSWRNNVISGALRYLAVLDTLIIWTTVLKLFVEGALGIHRDEEALIVCIVMVFLSELLSSIDNWLLVFITLTRVIHIKCPFKAQTYCSKFNYYGMLAFMHTIVFVTLAPPILYNVKYLTGPDTEETCITIVYRNSTYRMRVAYCIVNFITPAVTLVILNIILVHELKSMRERQERLHLKTPTPTASMVSLHSTISGMLKRTMDREGVDQTNNANYRSSQAGTCVSGGSGGSMKSSIHSQVLSQTAAEPAASSWKEPVTLGLSTSSTDDMTRRVKPTDSNIAAGKIPQGPSCRRDSRLQSLTRILLIANCVFLSLNTPFWIFHLAYQDGLMANTELGCHYRELIIDIFLLTRWSGHSLNFYFYCATGSRFRDELFSLLGRRRSPS